MMKRIKRLWMKKKVVCALAFFALRALAIMAPARLAANRLAVQFTRFKSVRVTFIFMLAAAVAGPGLLWPRPVWAAVTLDPNDPIGSGFRKRGVG